MEKKEKGEMKKENKMKNKKVKMKMKNRKKKIKKKMKKMKMKKKMKKIKANYLKIENIFSQKQLKKLNKS